MFVRLILVVALAAIVGCAPSATSVAPTSPPAQQQAPAAATPPPAAAPTGAALRPVKFAGSNAGAGNAPFYLGTELGYFAGQGIDFSEVFFPSASEVIPALTRGDVDAAVVGVNPATLNALASNFGIRVVADAGSQPPGYALNVFVKSKEVANTINGPADLRGRKIALTPPGVGTASGFMLSRYLAKANMTLNDVDVTPLNFPDQIAALSNHAIDVAQMAEPFAANVIKSGDGQLLVSGDQVEPNQQVAVMVYTDRFIGQQPDVANKLMVAYLQGVREYMNAMGTGADRDKVVQILMQKTDIKDPDVWATMYPPGTDLNGQLNVQSISDTQAYFQKLGLVQNPVDVSKVVDTSFTEAAVRTLGSAGPPVPPKR